MCGNSVAPPGLNVWKERLTRGCHPGLLSARASGAFHECHAVRCVSAMCVPSALSTSVTPCGVCRRCVSSAVCAGGGWEAPEGACKL
jgi:hypothetical protein